MAADKLERVLLGDLTDLPALASQTVRIFISSTFTDTKEERNLIMEKVCPQMKQLCRTKHSLEFQAVDMRWGVRDEATDDHMTSALCRDEIKLCHKDSTGPSFVIFLGQRYGYQSIPSVIDAKEFEELLKVIESPEDKAFLLEWYFRDDNALNQVYVLQPISSHLPHFLSNSAALREESQRSWKEILKKLQSLLRKASTECCSNATLSENARRKYFVSVTEEEIEEGVLSRPSEANKRCVCFMRVIEDIDQNLSHNLAWRFIDLVPGSPYIDSDAQSKLANLRDRLTNCLSQENIHRHSIKWHDTSGVSHDIHLNYLESAVKLFQDSLMHLIDEGMGNSQSLLQNTLYTEVLQHLHTADQRCSVFQGRHRELSKIREAIQKNRKCVLVVHGPSGCGKTSIIAKCTQQAPAWFSSKPAVVLQFLGTTPESSTISRTLMTLCKQLAFIYKKDIISYPDTFNDIQQLFEEMLCLASEDKPLVLLLDSLDQLSKDNNAHSLGWLPRDIPDNVFIVVSVLSDYPKIFDKLKRIINAANFVSVPVLGEETSLDILMLWLEDKGRTLTSSQIDIVRQAFHHCGLPLFVKLVFDEVLLWQSYYVPDSTTLAYSVREVINNLFSKLQRKHGRLIVKHTLAYITASKVGLGENELEDILSLDDIVLTDAFQYHVPPLRRFPVLLWLRIKHDISSYLAVREADGTRVIFWYHRQFIEAATSYFLDEANFIQDIHSLMADYWLGIWFNAAKPFQYTDYQCKKLNLKSCNSSADRQVAEQPLSLSTQDNKTYYNLRKLNNLPHHLLHSGRTEELKSRCLFDFHWLSTKIKAFSVQSVIQDLDLLSENDVETKLLKHAISLAGSTLGQDPTTLGVEILGRLYPFAVSYNIHLQNLASMCCSIDGGLRENAFLPMQQCYGALGGALLYTLEHPDMAATEKLIALSQDGSRLFVLTHNNALLVWDLDHGEIQKEIKLIKDDIRFKFNVCSVSNDKKYFCCASAFHKDNNLVAIIDLENEEVFKSVTLKETYPNIGFKDNYVVQKVREQLLVIVLNKHAACFDYDNGKVLHDFGIAPSCFALTKDDSLLLLHVKKTSSVEMYSIKTYSRLSQISMTSVPKTMVCDKASEKLFLVMQNSSLSVETIDLLHRQHGNVDAKRGPSINLAAPLQNKGKVESVALSSDESCLLVRTDSCFVVWDTRRNRSLHKLSVPNHVQPKYKVTSFQGTFVQDDTIVVAAYDNYLVFWSTANGKVLRTLRASSVRILNLLIPASNEIAITMSERSRIIQVWDLSHSEEEIFSPLGLSSACRYMSAAGAKDFLAVRSYDPTEARVIDLSTGSVFPPPQPEFESMQPRITNDGRFFILRSYNALQRAIKIWQSKSGSLVSSLDLSSLSLMNFACSFDNKFLVSHSETSPTADVSIDIWDISSGRRLAGIPLDEGGFSFISFADKNTKLVLLKQYPITNDGKQCKLLVYNITKRRRIMTLKNIWKDSSYVLEEGSEILAVDTTEAENHFVVYDASSLSLKRKMTCNGHPPVGRMAISGDCKTAVDVELRVLSLITGEIKAEFTDHARNLINKNAQIHPKISRDGSLVVWVELEGSLVKVGQVSSGDVIGRCYIHASPLSIQMSVSGTVALGTDDGRIMLLKVVDPQNPEQAEETINVMKKRIQDQMHQSRKGTGNLQKKTSVKQMSQDSSICKII